MKALHFDTAPAKTAEFAVNGDENNVISISLTDLNLFDRIGKASKELEDLQTQYADMQPEQLAQADAQIRRIIDRAFGSDICSHAFGTVNCLSMTKSGKPLFQCFFDAFVPLLKEAFEEFRGQAQEDAPDKVKPYLADLEKPSPQPDIAAMTQAEKQALLRQLLS